MIYLDNAATTFPKPNIVYDVMDQMNRNGAVNAGRGAYKAARKASALIEETKNMLRNLIHVDSTANVVFAPSITIAINQIVNGLGLVEKSVVYISPYEHNAVVRCLHIVSKKIKLHIKELPLDTNLEIDLEKMKYAFVKDKPDVVICTHVSNVTGYILPVREIFEEAKHFGSVTILDSAQSLGLLEIRGDVINADIIAFTGHKTLYGPIGVGGFLNISGINLEAFIGGGTGSDSLNLDMPNDAERRFEASSINIVAIAGLHAALKVLDQKVLFEQEQKLSQYLIKGLSSIKGVKLYVSPNLNNHVGVISFIVDGLGSEDIGIMLDEDFDIAVRTGYHCAPLIHKYLKSEPSLGTVRVGLGQFTTKEDIDLLIRAITTIEKEM